MSTQNPSLVVLAQAILDVQDLREASWSEEARAYLTSQPDAALTACTKPGHPEMSGIVGLMNKNAWNDVQEWATKYLRDSQSLSNSEAFASWPRAQ